MSFFHRTSRISVIFRVRSAKAVKITDASLIKKLGLLCGFVSVALLIRTLVSPPDVIVGRTADNLKAFLCKTDWWDHTFTSSKWCRWIPPKGIGFGFIDFFIVEFSLPSVVSVEVLFLAWGVRLCIVVRKAPSEFNESRFISMAIYNEFLLTCFLNVSMWVYEPLALRCLSFVYTSPEFVSPHCVGSLFIFSKTVGTSSCSNSQRRFMKSQSLRFFLPWDENSVAGLRLRLSCSKVATENRRRRFFRGKCESIEFTWGWIIAVGGRLFEFVWVNVHFDRFCLILEDADISLYWKLP